VLQVIDGLEVGGAQTVLLALLRHGREHGLELWVANVGRRYDPRLLDGVRSASNGVVRLSGRAMWDLRSLPALVRAIVRHDIDVVHGHLASGELYGGLAGRLTGRPAVATLHSVHEGRARDRGGMPPVRRRLANFATRRLAHRLLAVSQAVKDSYVNEVDVPPDRVEVLPNALGASAPWMPEDRARKRAELGVPTGTLACSVSRLTHVRDHATLLRALPAVRTEHPELTVLLVGDGPEREALGRLARELELEGTVRFLGTRHDAREILACSDVFLHPTQLEGLGMAVLEAMSLGVVPVAGRVPAIEEIVEDGRSGLLVAPGDVAGWERALRSLLGSPDLRRRMADAARARAGSQLDPHTWVERTEAVYRGVLGA
jgi:glycosyltransferase involved in cell wall biosynthesis